MKAVGYRHPLPITDPAALEDLQLPDPTPGPRDLLVRVRAVSVNPVDTKVRRSTAPAEGGGAKVLGWDAVGIVEAMGAEVQGFQAGDRVYYAGSIVRPGSNSELHAVDARIAALAPTTLDDAQAAALPLTSITACSSTAWACRRAAAPGRRCWWSAGRAASARSWSSWRAP